MEGYWASFWTTHRGSAHHMQDRALKKNKNQNQEVPLELHFKDVESTSIMEGKKKRIFHQENTPLVV